MIGLTRLDLQSIIDRIGAEMAAVPDRGRVADYIPELSTVDPAQFGMAVALPGGKVLTTGRPPERKRKHSLQLQLLSVTL